MTLVGRGTESGASCPEQRDAGVAEVRVVPPVYQQGTRGPQVVRDGILASMLGCVEIGDGQRKKTRLVTSGWPKAMTAITDRGGSQTPVARALTTMTSLDLINLATHHRKLGHKTMR